MAKFKHAQLSCRRSLKDCRQYRHVPKVFKRRAAKSCVFWVPKCQRIPIIHARQKCACSNHSLETPLGHKRTDYLIRDPTIREADGACLHLAWVPIAKEVRLKISYSA